MAAVDLVGAPCAQQWPGEAHPDWVELCDALLDADAGPFDLVVTRRGPGDYLTLRKRAVRNSLRDWGRALRINRADCCALSTARFLTYPI